MAGIELFPFQQEAADRLADTSLDYFVSGPDKIGGRDVPFVGQLKAVTGAGKTPILANVIGRQQAALVLWTTKFGSVVDQTVANLRSGGKYHHLLGKGPAEVLKFTEITGDAWARLIEDSEGITILVSTVAAWFSTEANERLNVHRPSADWGEKTRWEQLKTDRKRPLSIVYDEAHNTTTEQVEFLDDLGPAAFFVASASPLKGKLQLYLTQLPENIRKQRIIPVRTRDVVDAQLLKSTISLADYDSGLEEMLSEVVQRRAVLESKLKALNSSTIPRAIYVVEASNITARGEDARPVILWKMLVQRCGVPPEAIAVCTNTKDLPKDARRVATIDQLSDEYTHIIFNKKLQEGWDDPSVYVCYFDGKTESATRIQQVVGRALRQPGAKHLSDEDLNTAFFFLNCPTEAMERIVDQLKEELQIYRGDDAPNDFEPFVIKEARRSLERIPIRPEYVGKLRAPRFQAELPSGERLRRFIEQKTIDFKDADRGAPGRAWINVVSVRTGEVSHKQRDLMEDMRVRCGGYLQQQCRVLSKDCVSAIHPSVFSNDRLDKLACPKSKALTYYGELAADVVREYETNARLTQLSDEEESTYTVGDYQPSGTIPKEFSHAAHLQYDSKAFNPDEQEIARALDRFSEYVWVRNKPRLDYGIPLPIKSGSSSTFYPDFLWWVKGTVWALDPTGRFILEEKVRTKLLSVLPLRIALITREKYDSLIPPRKLSSEGWTLVRHRVGNTTPETFDTIHELLTGLVEASGDESSAGVIVSAGGQRAKASPKKAGAARGVVMNRRLKPGRKGKKK